MGCGASSADRGLPAQITVHFEQPAANGTFRRSIPLTPCEKYSHGAPISKNQLAFQREEFWTTRIGGNVIMWQAIKTASEAMIQSDHGLANAIIEASGITTPTGSLDTCYDETGYLYKIPRFCYSDPIELTDVNAPAELVSVSSSKRDTSTGTPVKLKVRINPGDINMLITVSSNDTIKDLKRAIQEYSVEAKSTGIPFCDENRQRVMLMGKELKNHHVVSQAGMEEGRVVQVFLRPQPAQASIADTAPVNTTAL